VAGQMDDAKQPELTTPAVSPELYDEGYYRNWCAGFAEWTASDGAQVAGIYPGTLTLAHLQPGEVVVDVGTGRGEMLAVAVEMGAARAIGIEYSPTAVEMARHTLDVHKVGDRAEVLLVDARAVPLEDDVADLATMVDVVEHLTPDELHSTLQEVRRILKPGGRVFIHTTPNRMIYEVTYRLQRAISSKRRRTWPVDPRKENERTMHVNEQTVTSLRRALNRAGFDSVRVRLGNWIYTDFVPEERAKKLYSYLARIPYVARLGVGDLFGEARKA
jgi:cyclopropane fatty-acyl-phospholipid synthase-like methyltransferase